MDLNQTKLKMAAFRSVEQILDVVLTKVAADPALVAVPPNAPARVAVQAPVPMVLAQAGAGPPRNPRPQRVFLTVTDLDRLLMPPPERPK